MLTTCVFCPPPDKGTVQKVIVLPSNQSLHEDLILEELEVFKVSSLFFCFLFIPLLLSSSQNQRRGRRRRRRRANLATPPRPPTDKRWVAIRRWTLCSVVQRGVIGNMLINGTGGTFSLYMLLYLSSDH